MSDSSIINPPPPRKTILQKCEELAQRIKEAQERANAASARARIALEEAQRASEEAAALLKRLEEAKQK